MGKDGKSTTATPRLRFPEFRKVGDWSVDQLVDVADFVNEKISVSKLVASDYVSTENLLPDYGGMTPTSKVPPTGSVTQYKRDDVLFSNIRPYLKKVWRADRDGGASNDVIVIRAKPLLSEGYLTYALKNDAFVAYVMSNAKGLKMPRGDVESMREYPVAYPRSAEQQKIVDCLTSLDDVIAAQGRKVAALAAHTRGLMQQLFPREGETIPRLRFPEFRDAPEWEIKPLSQVAENLDNKRIPITEKDRTKGDIPYYGASGIVDYVEDYIFDEDLLCVSEDGANLLARTYPIAFAISGKAWVNNHAHVLRFNKMATQKIVEAYLNATDLTDFITGMAQPKLNRAMLDTIPIPLPDSDEQQLIADCLIALDAQIAAESEKLDTLKTHKTGLMQQLFPSPDGD